MENRPIYLFANWKMYLDYTESIKLASAVAAQAEDIPDNIIMAIFPSALAAESTTDIFKKTRIATGAQNIHWVEKGGYTGESSAPMYRGIGCEYVLVGHSERRHLFHETNHEVRQKVEAALAAGLTPVICVGETDAERQANQTEEVIEAQIRSAFHNIVWPRDKKIIIAYEPVWAITKGDIQISCDPFEAERVHEIIKRQVIALTTFTPVILYGGSVQADNVTEYLKNPNIHGVLVGAASTNFENWLRIIRTVQ